MLLPLDRRHFLAAAVAAALPHTGRAAPAGPKDEVVAFFLVADTHYLADREAPGKLDRRSAAFTARLVDVLNRLPGTAIPEEAGGGTVLAPRGVIHAGDCIDTGDRAGNVKMHATEWAAFAADFGLTGKDGKLRVPVYEVHGNHDSPRGDGLAVKKIIARNKDRPGVGNVSKNGVHYSWDWGGIHFINLGIVVGQVASVRRKRRYAPLDSLDFLVSDLKEKVGTTGRPVLITHHVDVLRYAQPLPVEDSKARGLEWDPADVNGFHQALAGYNVAAILHGHTHARNVFRWDGTTKGAARGIPVFNVTKASHFAGKHQGFFYFEVRRDSLLVREYQTADSWQTSSWAPRKWTAPVAAKK